MTMFNTKKRISFFVFLAVCMLIVLSACSPGSIIAQSNSDTGIFMDTENYSTVVRRDVTIKNTQSGTFSVQHTPFSGKLEISITDSEGNPVMSVNQDTTLTKSPILTTVTRGNGTYHIIVNMEQFSGSYDIQWSVEEIKEIKG